MHVVDASDAHPETQITAVREVLREIGAGHIAEVIVFNKSDIADELVLHKLLRSEPNSVAVSAHTGQGIDQLLRTVDAMLPHPNVPVQAHIPYEHGDLLSRVLAHGVVHSYSYDDTGTQVDALVDAALAAELAPYVNPI